MAAVPRSAKPLGFEDKEGNMLIRIVVLAAKVDDYIKEAKRKYLLKKFVYDYEKYKQDLESKTVLE